MSKKKRKQKSKKTLPSQQKESVYNSGLFHFRSGIYEKAINIWSKISKDPDSIISPQLAEAHFRNAMSMYSLGNVKDAISEMHSVLKYDSVLPIYLFHAGLAYHRANKFPQAISYYINAINAMPDNERYKYHLAIAYLQNNDFQNSIDTYESLGDSKGLTGKALVYMSQGAYDKAIDILNTADNKGEANLIKGLIYLIQGKDSESKNFFKAAANDNSIRGISNYYLGIAHAKTQAMPSAIKAWDDAFQNGLSIQLIKDDVISVYRQLVPIYFDKGNLSKVVKIWEKLIELDPEDEETKKNLVHAYFLRGNDYAKSERFTYAIKYWQKAWDLDSTNPDLAHNLALAYEKQNKPRLASKYWQESAKGWKYRIYKNPNERDILKARLHGVHSHLASIALETDNIKKAIEEYREALKYVPEDVDTMIKISYLYIIDWDANNALKELEQANRLRPNDIDILHQMFMAYTMKKNIPRAIDCMREILKLDPSNEIYRKFLSDYYIERAEEARDDGKYKSALKFLEDGLEILTDNIELKTMVGGIYLKMEDEEKAEATFEEIIAINPKDPKIYMAIGRQYLEDDMIDRAESYFAQTIELAHDDPYIYIDIADQYCHIDDCDGANRYFEKAKDKGAKDINVLISIVERLLKRKCADYSIKYAKELVSLYLENPKAYYLLGVAYHIDENDDEAEKVLKKGRAIALKKSNFEVLDNIEGMLHHLRIEKTFGISWEDMMEKLEDFADDFDMDEEEW